jgi:hypothetical protein
MLPEWGGLFLSLNVFTGRDFSCMLIGWGGGGGGWTAFRTISLLVKNISYSSSLSSFDPKMFRITVI